MPSEIKIDQSEDQTNDHLDCKNTPTPFKHDRELLIMSLKCANQLEQKKIELRIKANLINSYKQKVEKIEDENRSKFEWYWIAIGIFGGVLLGGGIGVGIAK